MVLRPSIIPLFVVCYTTIICRRSVSGWSSAVTTTAATTKYHHRCCRFHCPKQRSTTSRRTALLYFAQTNDDDYDDVDEDDDEPPDVDIRNFRYNNNNNGNSNNNYISFGLGKGRSSPSQRKAMGVSSKQTTSVFVCTNCGCESVQWRGRCPTCQEWNTFQEFLVQRSSASSSNNVGGAAHNLLGRGGGPIGQPVFGSTQDASTKMGQSWLDGVPGTSGGYYNTNNNRPVSITDINLDQSNLRSRRLIVPDDEEMNSVLGGGIMKGSLLLLGGDPGVGKSTLALQVAIQIASLLSTPPVGIGMGPTKYNNDGDNNNVGPVWYVSGEETLEQIATRAHRLNEPPSLFVSENDDGDDPGDNKRKYTVPTTSSTKLPDQLFLLSETNINVLADQVVQVWMRQEQQTGHNVEDDEGRGPTQLPPSLIVIDSIQTMVCEGGGASSAGGVSQVRECMALLLRLAKTTQIPILTIGHVTKTGDVAGPRMVEHMVDAVLYLEHATSVHQQQGRNNYRWLRAQKNRFGSCQTVGLYDFQGGVLIPLPEGSETPLPPPSSDLEGCAMSICLEGLQRAMTVEVQALVTSSTASFGRKTVEGIPYSRLSLILGILQKHCQLPIAGSGGGKNGGRGRDVYVNVIGFAGASSKSQQASTATALDLAVAVALTSSYLRIPVRGDTAFLAHVGLLGELRPLPSLEARLLQAQRMGFSRVVVAGNSSFSSGSKKKAEKKALGSYGPGGSDGSTVRQTRKFDMDIFECDRLQQALDLALVAKIPKPRSSSLKKASAQKTSSKAVVYEEIILDDEDYDDDEQEGEEEDEFDLL